MIDLRKIQREQWIWAQKNFPDNKKWMPLVGIGEEVGELMHHFLKSAQNIRNQEHHYIEMIDAVGDICVYLMNFCSETGIDLENAIVETWQNVKNRDWQKNPDTAHLINNTQDENQNGS